MQRLTLLLILALFQQASSAQRIIKQHPQTLRIDADSFFVRFSNSPDPITLRLRTRDTVDMGTDAQPGMTGIIYYGKNDSLALSYHNTPFAEVYYIPMQSPSRKFVYRLHFNEINAYFPPAYILKNTNNVQLEIPEAYELANIIWTLSPSGQRATDLNKESAYYQKVLAWFKPMMDHPLLKQLDFADSVYFKNYYDFRENSFVFSFSGNKLVNEGPYYYVMGDNWDDFQSLFSKWLPLVQDFSDRSKFRDFYRENTPFYQQQVKREQELMPVKNMWSWLEKEFPNRKFKSYKIVFSPLIGGSHSTQNFATYSSSSGLFNESVMFVCNTDRYDKRAELSEQQKEGLMSGIVFTEIDHNYVNPVSNRYAKKIDSTFANRETWTKKEGDNKWYDSPVSVFNEYMTHAVFCLWVMDNYEKPVADYVINNRESLMVDKRHFYRFKEFNRALIDIREKNKNMTVMALYPAILDWCKTQN
ncbi:MAG: DUF4932 domain-containing protein [Bacteroidota bacterium]